MYVCGLVRIFLSEEDLTFYRHSKINGKKSVHFSSLCGLVAKPKDYKNRTTIKHIIINHEVIRLRKAKAMKLEIEERLNS